MDSENEKTDEKTPCSTDETPPNHRTSSSDESFDVEASAVYLLLKQNIPISRTIRFLWYLDRINTKIIFPPPARIDDDDDLEIVSILPCQSVPESAIKTKYLITRNTSVTFVAHSYRIVYCLDMSPSQSTVDIQRGEILFDEIRNCFSCSLRKLCQKMVLPGSRVALEHSVYLTVIAHTPFFMTPAQQVLIKGALVCRNNIDEVIATVERQLLVIEKKISQVAAMAHDELDSHKNEADRLTTGLLPEDTGPSHPFVPMVPPDANFINMLRYSMLALSLLPENNLSNILVITDGVVTMPDITIMESLLMQLRYDSTALSFLIVGSGFVPESSAGYVPYVDLLQFLAHATLGTCLIFNDDIDEQSNQHPNIYHESFLTWSFRSRPKLGNSRSDNHSEWRTRKECFDGGKVPVLLAKKQSEDKVNTSLALLLSRRMLEGYTVDCVLLDNTVTEIRLSLPWKQFIYFKFSIVAQWPSNSGGIQYGIEVLAPYEFLHDITCVMKKELKSNYRQAVVERFWYALVQLTSGDKSMLVHLNACLNSGAWFSLPESVRNGMPVFTWNGNDSSKSQFVPSDVSSPKFISLWQPICQIESSGWRKWFHTQKLSLILQHDRPLPSQLQATNSYGRYQVIQCRQAAAALYTMLAEWASFVLIENHTYVKLLTKDVGKERTPIWFAMVKLTTKLPCVVLHIAFSSGTPGHLRLQVYEKLRSDTLRLSYMATASKNKENNCCNLLQKPLEKILVRYERMPSDFNTVVFPDGTQPSDVSRVPVSPVAGTLFTTLSRFLYHRRWIYPTSHLHCSQLGFHSVSRILSTLTEMRLKEGFSFAHFSSGIINMVLEVEMSLTRAQDASLSCVVQYVLFPPHSDVRDHQASGSEGERDSDPECETDLHMVTEVWIEPQFGWAISGPDYMRNESYYGIADKIRLIDSKCVSSLLTLEHLSLMCQNNSKIIVDTKSASEKVPIRRSSETSRGPVRKRTRNSSRSGFFPSSRSFFEKTFDAPSAADSNFGGDSIPFTEDRIHHAPFRFNLKNILPICNQTELLFSTFLEEDEAEGASDKSNSLLIESFHDHMLNLHDRELHLGLEDSKHFVDLLLARSRARGGLNPAGEVSAGASEWRCFIKGAPDTRVILTFVPANMTALKSISSSHGEAPSTLAVFVYDCSLASLTEAHVSKNTAVQDSFEDLTTKNISADHLLDKSFELEHVQQHCHLMALIHSKCFVVSLFKALHCQSFVHDADVRAAVSRCEGKILDIDITDYLKTICGHLKCCDSDPPRDSSCCRELGQLRNMIKDKFLRILKTAFQPIPTNEEYYFCHPVDVLAGADVAAAGDGEEEESPLFLQLTCSVHWNRRERSWERFPVRVLPTCVAELVGREVEGSWAADGPLKITLDVVCLTLPQHVQLVAESCAIKGPPKASFFATSSLFRPDRSLPPEALDCSCLLGNVQQACVKKLEAEIKWLLADEVATALLDVDAVTEDTLRMVAEHVASSEARSSCMFDRIELNFVCDMNQSHGKFLLEFRRLPIPRYRLVEEGDLYYLAKSEEEPAAVVFRVGDEAAAKDQGPDSLCSEASFDDSAPPPPPPPPLPPSPPPPPAPPLPSTPVDGDVFDWLVGLDRRRSVLPNFWLIMKVERNAVTIYFHCRFLELGIPTVQGYLDVHSSVIVAIKDLCKRVNQSLLLQSLHDTRVCDSLLEKEDLDAEGAAVVRNPSLLRLRSMEEVSAREVEALGAGCGPGCAPGCGGACASGSGSSPGSDDHCFPANYFSCSVVWEYPFSLHPRLKTGPGKPGLSRGIQALKTVLNKFSVSNRNNMFVYRDNNFNVFYLRLHEYVQNSSKLLPLRAELEPTSALVSRSPSIVSLPLGPQKTICLAQSETSVDLSAEDIRPRVRSFGEKESKDAPSGDIVVLRVHGISQVGPDVTNELVQVLQNRLDDAVLEVISTMLARNSMCPLNPEDVHFLQKPFKAAEHVVRHAVQRPAVEHVRSFVYYLKQNLLQFLNVPKYTDQRPYYHFHDYTELEPGFQLASLKAAMQQRNEHVFIYNQSQNPSSGSRGIACVAFDVLASRAFLAPQDDFACPHLDPTTFRPENFEDMVASARLEEPTASPVVEFRIWKQGRVNLDSLSQKLQSAMRQACWDLITEYHIVRYPLCCEADAEMRHLICRLRKNLFVKKQPAEPEGPKANASPTPTKKKPPKPARPETEQEQEEEDVEDDDEGEDDDEEEPEEEEEEVEEEVEEMEEMKEMKEMKETKEMKEMKEEKPAQGKPPLDAFELGEQGVVHQVYSVRLSEWLDFGLKIAVPAVKVVTIPLSSKHSMGVCVRELQQLVSQAAQDTATRIFTLLNAKPAAGDGPLVCVPYEDSHLPSRCLLVGRNFEQWKVCTSPAGCDHHSVVGPQAIRSFQKFTSKLSKHDGLFVPRQRLLLAFVSNDNVAFYTYNWSKDRLDKLVSSAASLGMWLCVRAGAANSIIAQKLGLFHNQALLRKSLSSSGNPFLGSLGEVEHLHKFPSSTAFLSKEWANRRPSAAGGALQGVTGDSYRDTRPSLVGRVCRCEDIVVSFALEMQEMRAYNKMRFEEQRELLAVWESRGSTSDVLERAHLVQVLRQHSRIIHYCHTPLLFLPRWRLKSASTRDHSLSPPLVDRLPVNGRDFTDGHDSEAWHDSLCSGFVNEYKSYLKTLGFSGLSAECAKRNKKLSAERVDPSSSVCHMQKSMLGGILVFTINLQEPFLIAKLHAIECNRLTPKVSRASLNQFTLSFVDECDKIKIVMHLHSFTYDFHLRCIHNYVSNSQGVKVCTGYHLTNFLDDFMKYYSKAPNYARNLVYADTITIENLITEGRQLYDYLLSNEKQYNMEVLTICKDDANGDRETEYVLVQVTSSKQVSYKDSQDRQHTDDFNITLIVSNLCCPWKPWEKVIHLKYYIILTSKREIYPKPEVEKKLGKFRTVSWTGRSPAEGVRKISTSEDGRAFRRPDVLQGSTERPSATVLEDVVTAPEDVVTVMEDEKLDDDEAADKGEGDGEAPETETPETEAPESETLESEASDKPEPKSLPGSVVNSHPYLEIRQESVNYLGYYSSHEQLMQQLMLDRAMSAHQQIRDMVEQGMVHCRIHLLWNKLVSHHDTNQLSYEEFMELRGLARLENVTDLEPLLRLLLGQTVGWYQAFGKLLLVKYGDQNRVYHSPDGNVQHIVILHPRYVGAFMMLTVDLHTSRGDLYAAYREPLKPEFCEAYIMDQKSLLDGFINCICYHIWAGMLP